MKRWAEIGYLQRDPISLAVTLLMGLVFGVLMRSVHVSPPQVEAPTTLQIQFESLRLQQPDPVTQPPKPTQVARSSSTKSTDEPKPIATQSMDSASAQEVMAQASASKQEGTAPKAIAHEAPKTAVPDVPKPTTTNALYLADLLAYLEKIKRYPTSREARLSRPQGTVVVWLELDRQGTLKSTGLMESSGSNLLDGEALKTVKSGVFPAMSDDVFVQQASHRFIVHLKYEVK
jgi:protein TonB